MNPERGYQVPTKVLCDQARATLNALAAPGNADALAALAAEGLDPKAFVADLSAAHEEAVDVEAAQERAKQAYKREAAEDREVAELGYRWILRLQAKGRHYLTTVDDDPEGVADRFRPGQIRRARARGVVYEMRILIPEAEQLQSLLAPFGVDAAFVAEGRQILGRLGVDRQETADALAERRSLTRDVRKAEKRIVQLLERLVSADAAAALLRPEGEPAFALHIIRAERARVDAARALRVHSRPEDTPGPDAPVE